VSGGLRPVSDLDCLSEGQFAEALRPLFEAARPLAHALYAARPFNSYEQLLDTASAIAMRLPRAQQIEVVNAHPRIGESPALVSQQSYREQGYEAERTIAVEELAETYAKLRELNSAYEARFGFRFVVFVNQRPKAAIVQVLKERIVNSAEEELATALQEMMRIARDRLASSG
jgi:2-oxo-4-hydroxy-4-carboxy-5-ureidoimidazoline decarboxylase